MATQLGEGRAFFPEPIPGPRFTFDISTMRIVCGEPTLLAELYEPRSSARAQRSFLPQVI